MEIGVAPLFKEQRHTFVSLFLLFIATASLIALFYVLQNSLLICVCILLTPESWNLSRCGFSPPPPPPPQPPPPPFPPLPREIGTAFPPVEKPAYEMIPEFVDFLQQLAEAMFFSVLACGSVSRTQKLRSVSGESPELSRRSVSGESPELSRRSVSGESPELSKLLFLPPFTSGAVYVPCIYSHVR